MKQLTVTAPWKLESNMKGEKIWRIEWSRMKHDITRKIRHVSCVDMNMWHTLSVSAEAVSCTQITQKLNDEFGIH